MNEWKWRKDHLKKQIISCLSLTHHSGVSLYAAYYEGKGRISTVTIVYWGKCLVGDVLIKDHHGDLPKWVKLRSGAVNGIPYKAENIEEVLLPYGFKGGKMQCLHRFNDPSYLGIGYSTGADSYQDQISRLWDAEKETEKESQDYKGAARRLAMLDSGDEDEGDGGENPDIYHGNKGPPQVQ